MLEKLRSDIRRWGWMRSLFMRVTARLKKYAGFEIYRIIVRHLGPQPHGPQLPGDITLRAARLDELLQAAGDPELDMNPDFVREAQARGDMAFGAFDGDRLVSYTWRTFTAAPHVGGLWARVERPCVYGYKALTRPSYRGKRIQVAVSLFSDAYLIERGYTDMVAFIEISNFASLGVQKFLGSRMIGYAGYVKWFGRPVPFRTRAVKKIGFMFEFRP